MVPHGSALQTIGNTPTLGLTRMDAGPCRPFVKLANRNPAGSIEDRSGLAIGGATAGNTGLGQAPAASRKG